MSEITQAYDGQLWRWDRDGGYWYTLDGDELAPWDVFATMCAHDAHITQLEADNEALRELWQKRKVWYERYTEDGWRQTKFDVDIDTLLEASK